MHHSTQSSFCSNCNIKFRSHRALKAHRQRFHSVYSRDEPDYSYISSYLVVPFSTQIFPLIAKTACEQGRLPLGYFTSKFFRCELCSLSYPCSKALKYHHVNTHEQYEYKLCKNILHNIILQIEQNLKIADDNTIESIKLLLSKQASNFGLIDKQLSQEFHRIKQEKYQLIFPKCQHRNRTCANLCLKHLSSYNKLIENYPYEISKLPKDNPFIQGSIVSKSTNQLSAQSSTIFKEESNNNQKRASLKRIKSSLSDGSSSPQPKRKLSSIVGQSFKVI